MIYSLALIFLFGILFSKLFQLIKLPRIIGMLITGIILGPYVLNLLNNKILDISSDLRQIALIIILIKAGLSLDLNDLKKVGRPAILMSFLPACFEIIACVVIGPVLFNISIIDSLIIGAVLSAVSPAVVVPKMVELIEKKYGTKKSIPQLILAASSLDDVFVIILFTSFVAMAESGTFEYLSLVNIPISIILGILTGIVVGLLFSTIVNKLMSKENNSILLLLILSIAFLLVSLETWLEGYISISGLLAVMSMAMTLRIKLPKELIFNLTNGFGEVWKGAEVLLFVLVGAAVNINYAFSEGINTIILIIFALLIRSIGVYISLIGTSFNLREKLFCIIAYLPKATVQAAIGAIPLTLGLSCGNLVLSIAVISILITAPVGALGMDLTYKSFLKKE